VFGAGVLSGAGISALSAASVAINIGGGGHSSSSSSGAIGGAEQVLSALAPPTIGAGRQLAKNKRGSVNLVDGSVRIAD
jgi:hypothetical protein